MGRDWERSLIDTLLHFCLWYMTTRLPVSKTRIIIIARMRNLLCKLATSLGTRLTLRKWVNFFAIPVNSHAVTFSCHYMSQCEWRGCNEIWSGNWSMYIWTLKYRQRQLLTECRVAARIPLLAHGENLKHCNLLLLSLSCPLCSYGSPDYVHTDITGQQEKEARPKCGPCVEYSLSQLDCMPALDVFYVPLTALHFSVCKDLHRCQLTGMCTNILHDGETSCPNIRAL